MKIIDADQLVKDIENYPKLKIDLSSLLELVDKHTNDFPGMRPNRTAERGTLNLYEHRNGRHVTTLYCTNCGRISNAETKYCPHCGFEMVDKKGEVNEAD